MPGAEAPRLHPQGGRLDRPPVMAAGAARAPRDPPQRRARPRRDRPPPPARAPPPPPPPHPPSPRDPAPPPPRRGGGGGPAHPLEPRGAELPRLPHELLDGLALVARGGWDRVGVAPAELRLAECLAGG